MPTGSLSKFNISLGFGLRKGIKFQIKNQVQRSNRSSSKLDFEFGYNRNPYFSRTMATSGPVAACGDMIVDNLISSCGNVSNFARPTGHFVERNKSFQVASLGMRNRGPNKSHGVHGYFIFGVTHMGSSFGGQLGRRYNTLSSTCYSDGGVSDGVLKCSSHDEGETITSLAIEVDGYVCLVL